MRLKGFLFLPSLLPFLWVRAALQQDGVSKKTVNTPQRGGVNAGLEWLSVALIILRVSCSPDLRSPSSLLVRAHLLAGALPSPLLLLLRLTTPLGRGISWQRAAASFHAMCARSESDGTGCAPAEAFADPSAPVLGLEKKSTRSSCIGPSFSSLRSTSSTHLSSLVYLSLRLRPCGASTLRTLLPCRGLTVPPLPTHDGRVHIHADLLACTSANCCRGCAGAVVSWTNID